MPWSSPAAALTLGSHAVPVYEIYKAGFDPHWVAGLDLVRTVTGLPVVVIPHDNNTEGGHHDTRYCYLGEERLSIMEDKLPDESFILGVDEHTAVLLDLDAGNVSVLGNGVLTIRRHGHSRTHPAGSVLELAALGVVQAGSRMPGAPNNSTVDAQNGGKATDTGGAAAEVSLRAAARTGSAWPPPAWRCATHRTAPPGTCARHDPDRGMTRHSGAWGALDAGPPQGRGRQDVSHGACRGDPGEGRNRYRTGAPP